MTAGGPRKGAGRKPIPHNEKKKHTYSYPDSDADKFGGMKELRKQVYKFIKKGR